jgi:hypothetical protein
MPPLPATGQISLGQIQNEFGSGSSGGTRIGQYRNAYSAGGVFDLPFDTGIPTGNVPIAFSQFRGKQLNTVQVINGGGGTTVRYAIDPNAQIAVGGLRGLNSFVRSTAKNIVYVYNINIGSSQSGDRRVSALRTNTTGVWYGGNNYILNGASITLNIVSSSIVGAGGNGGQGGTESTNGNNGANGTSALGLQVPVSAINLFGSNLIAGGGGGGGGGGSREDSSEIRRAGGGGGGGGAGIPAGAGGGIRRRSNQSEGGIGSNGSALFPFAGGKGGGGSNNASEARGGSGGGGGAGISGGQAGDSNGGDPGGTGNSSSGGRGGDGNATGSNNSGESDGGFGGLCGFSIVSDGGIGIPGVSNSGSNFVGGTGAGQGVL